MSNEYESSCFLRSSNRATWIFIVKVNLGCWSNPVTSVGQDDFVSVV